MLTKSAFSFQDNPIKLVYDIYTHIFLHICYMVAVQQQHQPLHNNVNNLIK